jgi:hypothetical protein
MLGSDRVFLTLALVTTLTVGCGGGGDTVGSGGQGGTTSSSVSTTSSSGGGGSSGSGIGPPPTAATAPVYNPAIPILCGGTTVLAVNQLFFGEGDNGQWKQFGFNIDGLVSTAQSTNLCQPAAGATPAEVYPDGNNGIDNSFGANLLPEILSLDPTWVSDINNGIQAGTFTVLLELDCLPAKGDVSQFTTKLFGGTALGMTPKWDGTDKWPVEPDLLNNPTDPESSSIVFPGCSLTDSNFYSGKNVTFVLTVPVMTAMMSTSIKLTLYAAQMTMTLSADHKTASAGMIGGVLNTQELLGQVEKIAVLLNLCTSSVLPELITTVEQASDILADGTQDPTQTCDGISMGLGFTMAAAEIGVVGPAAPVGMSCGP